MSHTGGWRNDLLGRKPNTSPLAAWIYLDNKTQTRWVWVAQADDLAPIHNAASRLLSGLIPKESAIVEAVSSGLADLYQTQCSGPSVPKGGLLRSTKTLGAANIKGGGRILWQELSMIDPPLKHKDPQAVVDWIHASLTAQFPGIHPPMALADRDVDLDHWGKSIIEPSLIRARSLSEAREIRLATHEPGAGPQIHPRL